MSILASLNCHDEVHLFVGISGITYSRVQSVLFNNAKPIIISHDPKIPIPSNLKHLIQDNNIPLHQRPFDSEIDLLTLGRSQVGGIVDKVYVNLSSNYHPLKKQIFEKCQIYRIPINTTDSSEFSTFTFLSTYKDGDFQLGITTSGKGCKLANRIKREIVSQLPKDLGKVCETVGELRKRIQDEDRLKLAQLYKSEYENFLEMESGEHEEDSVQSSRFNTFISEFNMSEAQKKLQRSRWLSQVVEYYPFSKLASLSLDDLSSAYSNSSIEGEKSSSTSTAKQQETTTDSSAPVASSSSSSSQIDKTIGDSSTGYNPANQTTTTLTTSLPEISKKGSISLVGAGPGSVSLLTLGALSEINTADLVLADKLVPQQVLDLIPFKTEKFIARKFPGNAEAAQEELLQMGINALKEGKKVVRLKQGDPYIFGRGGEEYKYFEGQGYTPIVLPGITSALSSTVNSKIPATQRDVADQVLICTGTGRRGVLPNLPEFVKSRTTVFLMALHRINDLVPELIAKGWDPKVPANIVERSSCPDQRITRTRLEDLVDAVEAIGSRPPGLLVVGYACEVLNKPLLNERWVVEEGYESNEASDSSITSILETLKA